MDVNIVEAISSDRRLELNDLRQDFTDGVKKYSSYRSFDRIALGNQQQPVSGLEVLDKNSNLMVLGNPGSGKTTYLQRIVTECNQGNLQPHRIPILIKLRDFVEDDDARKFEYKLEPYLAQKWQLDKTETELILNHGKALILLDGLDEVSGTDGREISKKIKQFARNYPQNKFIVTCRTQSVEDKINWKSLRFIFVEVEDFNKEQVHVFVKHFFKAVCSNTREGLIKAKQFVDHLYLEENRTIRELTITPILLNLSCAVFHARGKFDSKRLELYEEALELLLENWDREKAIERDEIYKDLSVEQKQELLSNLAEKKFEQPQYLLFEQKEIEGYIAELLETSKRDSRAVLKSIENQHGLLIQRTQKFWSFSHLTFQEYLVAKKIVDSSCTSDILFNLVEHIKETHWQEVFLLVATMTSKADELILLMKQKIDNLIEEDEKLQDFLIWTHQKVLSIEFPYKAAAVRALYFYLDFNCLIEREQYKTNDLNISCDWQLAHSIDKSFKDALEREYIIEDLVADYSIASHEDCDPSYLQQLETKLANMFDIPELVKDINDDIKIAEEIFNSHLGNGLYNCHYDLHGSYISDITHDSELKNDLEEIFEQIINTFGSTAPFMIFSVKYP
ncbi:NACHT domain-containing protein [Anabaena sp. AL09]|uniref:NACHT domain-containing protein n=1 Tax=Anabaena sp. AL09 TaxID=1710891 RepID=UPI00260B6ACE|nr:NACHT domain-containing protein [Anabaena sp. AL09]